MRIPAALVLASLLALALSGCAGNDGDGGETSTSSSSSSSRSASPSSTSGSATGTTTSSTSTGTGSPNQAPAGSISATVNGTSALFNLTGSDPDGEQLVWELDFGDGNATNGTALPATVRHNYTAPGNVTVNFTLTDGRSPVTYNVTVTLTGTGGGPGPQVVEGDWVVGMSGCPQITVGEPYSEWNAALDGLNGIAFVKFDVDPTTIGKTFTMAATQAGTAGYAEIDFYNSGGTIIEYFPNPTPISPGTVTATGTVPSGSAFAVMFPCHPAPGSFTYSAG